MLILKNRKTVDAQIEFEQQQKKREEKKISILIKQFHFGATQEVDFQKVIKQK
jgi:hypothetical protein